MFKGKLELIEAFEKYSLYYNEEDKSLWIYNGDKYYGVNVDEFYRWLKE